MRERNIAIPHPSFELHWLLPVKAKITVATLAFGANPWVQVEKYGELSTAGFWCKAFACDASAQSSAEAVQSCIVLHGRFDQIGAYVYRQPVVELQTKRGIMPFVEYVLLFTSSKHPRQPQGLIKKQAKNKHGHIEGFLELFCDVKVEGGRRDSFEKSWGFLRSRKTRSSVRFTFVLPV